jgi:toxin YoeB
MKTAFTKKAYEDREHWSANDPEIVKKIINLIEDIKKTPFKGLGKPEPLKGDFSGYWSRRITNVDRLVYKIEGKGADKTLTIYQCRYHYDD